MSLLCADCGQAAGRIETLDQIEMFFGGWEDEASEEYKAITKLLPEMQGKLISPYIEMRVQYRQFES